MVRSAFFRVHGPGVRESQTKINPKKDCLDGTDEGMKIHLIASAAMSTVRTINNGRR